MFTFGNICALYVLSNLSSLLTSLQLHRILNFLFGNISAVFMSTESMFHIFVTSVADPDPGPGAFFDPWIRDPGCLKSQDPDRDPG